MERKIKEEDPYDPYELLEFVEFCEVEGQMRRGRGETRRGRERKRGREKEKGREKGKEERGGQERENKEWNINRFASDYNAWVHVAKSAGA